MGSGIFLIGNDEQLVQLTPQPYDSEDLLQRLLESHPSVLAGDQIERRVRLVAETVRTFVRLEQRDRSAILHDQHNAARSREGFARGALKAAQWIKGKSGLYEFSETLFA